MLASHSSVVLEAFTEIRQEPIWRIADGRYGMDRTHPPGTTWQLSRMPWAKRIMDGWQNDAIREQVLKAPSKCGKTTPVLMCLAWSMKYRPVPKLWLSGDDQMAGDAAEEYIHPVLERCPDLDKTLRVDRLHKRMQAIRTMLCTLHIRGAQGNTVLDQMSYGEIFADECRKFPDGALQKLDKRMRNFADAKRFLLSAPNIAGDEFDCRFQIGSQGQWVFPCEGCEDMIPIVFSPQYSQLPDDWKKKSQVMFPDNDTCWVECHCNHRHFDVPKTRRWIIDHGDFWSMNTSTDREVHDPLVESLHWNAFVPPDLRWQPHIDEFKKALAHLRHGNTEPLKIFVCETLGDSWEEGQQYEKKSVGLAGYSVKDPVSTEWHCIILTIDVQQYGFWYVVRGWRKDGSSRLLDCGELQTWGDITKTQERFGIKNPRFVFLDARWNGAAVHRECARYGWTAYIGMPRKSFPHPHPTIKGKSVYRLYSRLNPINCGIGLKANGRKGALYCREFGIATPTLEAMFQEHLENPELRFELPSDLRPEYMQHARATIRDLVPSKSTGALQEVWKQIHKDDHLRDCEKMGIAAASMAKCITVDPPEDMEGETK